jgi:hypothetical protein
LDRITLFYTKDGGHTWQKTELVVSISTPQQVYPIDIISFTFLNAQTGWLLRSTGGGNMGGNAAGGFMPAGATEEIADWWGVIKSTAPGAQYDDYFERQDLGQAIYFGIDSLNPAVQAQIVALRDSGKIVHLYGTLFSNVPDYNGSQVQVDRIEVEE